MVNELYNKVVTLLCNLQVEQLVSIDVRNNISLFDYLMIGTINSPAHAGSIVKAILEDPDLKKIIIGVEGLDQSGWILIDFDFFLINLMDEQTRNYYRLEDKWHKSYMVKLCSAPE